MGDSPAHSPAQYGRFPRALVSAARTSNCRQEELGQGQSPLSSPRPCAAQGVQGTPPATISMYQGLTFSRLFRPRLCPCAVCALRAAANSRCTHTPAPRQQSLRAHSCAALPRPRNCPSPHPITATTTILPAAPAQRASQRAGRTPCPPGDSASSPSPQSPTCLALPKAVGRGLRWEGVGSRRVLVGTRGRWRREGAGLESAGGAAGPWIATRA